MATLQKPRTKKKKTKTQLPVTQDEILDNERILSKAISSLDLVARSPKEQIEQDGRAESSPIDCEISSSDEKNTVEVGSAPPKSVSEKPVERINSKEGNTDIKMDPVERSCCHVEPLQSSSTSARNTEVTTPKSAHQPLMVRDLEEAYYCPEIERMKLFEERLLNDSLEENFKGHDLYLLLNTYMELRTEIAVILNDIKNSKGAEMREAEHIWIKESRRAEAQGTCGDGKVVKSAVIYEVLCVDTNQLENTSVLLADFQKLLCERYILNVFKAKQIKAEIEYAVREITSYLVPQNANKRNLDPDFQHCIQHLRLAVSIFFCFLRKPIQDKVFLDDLRSWLLQLVAFQSRLTTSEDHWFLLFHLLRCPSKISWGIPMVQVPAFVNSEACDTLIDSSMTLLSILLSPIRKRNEFLKQCADAHRNISDCTKGDFWILVDSDGEEGSTPAGECVGLKESDLIDILNQIPFEKLFCTILNIEKQGEDYIVSEDKMTEMKLTRIIAFHTTMIKLLGSGLKTYGSERYRQFTKRLGYLMKHCIHYTYDCYQIIVSKYLLMNLAVPERISNKFDAFILSACDCLHKSRCLSVSQFFQNIPFKGIHKRTLYALFYFLNVGFPEEISLNSDYEAFLKDDQFWHDFNVRAKDATNEDLYYLLQTFLEMALARDETMDWDFIKTLFIHIFFIGYINETTRNICYKPCKDVLSSLALLYPKLISDLIKITNENMISHENVDYMFKSMPLEIWKPDEGSLKILTAWLLNCPSESKENILSRIIIGRMNWGFNSDNELFLARDIHVRIACVVCEAASKYSSDINGSLGIPVSVSQASNTVDAHSQREQFSNWCWNVISTLHLHYLDQGERIAMLILGNPAHYLRCIPDLHEVEVLFQGVSEKRPMAIYLSMLITLRGHSIPLICQKSFDQMLTLLLDQQYTVVIRCLELITILFVECPEVLTECDRFHKVLQGLLDCDKTYINMAKNKLIDCCFGATVEIFKDMLQSQILDYAHYGLSSPQPLITLWFKSMLNLPNWEEPTVLYVIDGLLKVAHRFSNLWWELKNLLRYQYTSDKTKEIKSTLKTLFGSSKSKRRANEKFPWYSLICLEVEYEIFEGENNLWCEVLHQFKLDKNINLESALRLAAARIGNQHANVNDLTVFKYAEIITSIGCDNYLLPIFSQQFFLLYLCRIPYNNDEERYKTYFGIADKIQSHNPTLLKKVKAQFKAAEDFYTKECEQMNGDSDQSSQFYTNLCRLFKAYQIWLDDMSINAISKNQHIALPPQFFTEKLISAFSGRKDHWIEFLNTVQIGSELERSKDFWRKCCLRHPSGRKTVEVRFPSTRSVDPIKRITNHLRSYDDPQNLLSLSPRGHRLGNVNLDNANCDILKLIKFYVKTLTEYSRKCNIRSQEIMVLNKHYEESLTKLYSNVSHNIVQLTKCTSIFSAPIYSCANAAKVTVTVEKPRKNTEIQKEIDNNRKKYGKLVDSIVSQNFDETEVPVESMQYIVKHLTTLYYRFLNGESNVSQLPNASISSFYEFVDSFENIMSFAPSHELWRKMITSLGIFIRKYQQTEGPRVLKSAILNPAIIDILSEVVTPSTTNSQCFIKMYQTLIESYMECSEPKIMSTLLAKFDAEIFVSDFQPNLNEVSHFLKLIFAGLERWHDDETLQGLFRQHLICIFEFDFPEHYGEVLQALLQSCKAQKIQVNVIMDIINSFFTRSSCDRVESASQPDVFNQVRKFAANQKLFDFKSIMETMKMLAEYFRAERIKYGLHGLYPHYEKYTEVLAILFSCFGHAAIVSAIHTYPGELAEQISERVFNHVAEMYSPWTIVYTERHLRGCTMNWIWQLVKDGKSLYPWSENHSKNAKTIIDSLIHTLKYATVVLAVPNSVLCHVFDWYFRNFVNRETSKFIRHQLHNGIIQLPWEHFYPQPIHLEAVCKVLSECLPEIHTFVGYIFLKVQWTEWYSEIYSKWSCDIQTMSINFLYIVIVKISFEPNVHANKHITDIIEDSLSFSWNRTTYEVLENVFSWLLASLEPTFILQLPSEKSDTDSAILNLVKHVSGMKHGETERSSHSTRAKRILYVQKIMELLKKCGSKNMGLLEKPEGQTAFRNVIMEIMLDIENVVRKNFEVLGVQDDEALNLLSEVLNPSQFPSDYVKQLTIEGVIMWQKKYPENRLILMNLFDIIASNKFFDVNGYSLLESTIYHYLKRADPKSSSELSAWKSIRQRLDKCFDHMDLLSLIHGRFLLILHIFIIYKMQFMDYKTQITFIQDIVQLLETVKQSEDIEPKFATLWGAIMSIGFQTLPFDETANKPLLVLAKNLSAYASDSDSWSSGLLGIVGLKRSAVTNRFIMLSRCLACLIFSFCDEKQAYQSAMEELKSAINSRRNSDIKVLSTKCVDIIEEKMFVSESIVNRTFNIIQLFYNDNIISITRHAWTSEECMYRNM
ncbi:unnamed protein product [Hermetia illucens]|uniref:Uncharacterized protein n=1 Tax=Hermetia illucens TaxID=343691 RepID=A0A7R8UQN2_HERIL|nr:ectopic P granules protein 5 homolog isoform X2 [Hermetia illucens]CAD7085229.1 unnamed protein product [Hermetia illucens]